MKGDGNGWIRCALGHRHWGRFGAAGLLLVRGTRDGQLVLMQHRAGWTSEGGTWGIPGGARDSHETTVQAALREATEEAGIGVADFRVAGLYRDDHRDWEYVTVAATPLTDLALTANAESADLRWVRIDAVQGLRLHPGFARTWPRLRSMTGDMAWPVTS